MDGIIVYFLILEMTANSALIPHIFLIFISFSGLYLNPTVLRSQKKFVSTQRTTPAEWRSQWLRNGVTGPPIFWTILLPSATKHQTSQETRLMLSLQDETNSISNSDTNRKTYMKCDVETAQIKTVPCCTCWSYLHITLRSNDIRTLNINATELHPPF